MFERPDLLIIAIISAGCGLVFLLTERFNRTSLPLSLCLLAIGIDIFLKVALGTHSILGQLLSHSCEAAAIFLGIEWGRRVGETCQHRRKREINGLFRASQILGAVFWGLSLGYVIIFPENATSDEGGFFRARGYEVAVFAPILGTQLLLSTIAVSILLFIGIDKAEAVRLRALTIGAPFLISALVVNDQLVPFMLAIGLLWYVGGSVRYLYIQGQRGQFMSQFLSPEVAKVVRSQGMDSILKQERRQISVVFCDLRGFTAYARAYDSDDVAHVLTRYYDVVGQIAARHGGTVKDHAGDGILLLIGAPLPLPHYSQHALALATDIRDEVGLLLADISEDLGIGVGIATGKVTVGAIQGAGRLEYVAVGTAVNLASRLCDRAENGQILSDNRTRQTYFESLVDAKTDKPMVAFHAKADDVIIPLPSVGVAFELLGEFGFKGFDGDIQVYSVGEE